MLCVGLLAFSAEESDLYEKLERFEIASTQVVKDRVNGKFRGYGSVNFTNGRDVEAALREADGGVITGRECRLDHFCPGINVRKPVVEKKKV